MTHSPPTPLSRRHLSVFLPASVPPSFLQRLPLRSLAVQVQNSEHELLQACSQLPELCVLEVTREGKARSVPPITCADLLQLCKLRHLEVLKLSLDAVHALRDHTFTFPNLRVRPMRSALLLTRTKAAFFTRCEEMEWPDVHALVLAMPLLYIVHVSGLSLGLGAPRTVGHLQVISWPGSCVISRQDDLP